MTGQAQARTGTPRGVPWALVTLVLLTAATWLAVLVLADLPPPDAAGRGPLHVRHSTNGWWQALLTLVASLLSVLLAAWLPVVAVRRWVPARWRPLTAALAAVVVLVVAGWLALLSFRSLASTGLEGTRALVTGADGRR